MLSCPCRAAARAAADRRDLSAANHFISKRAFGSWYGTVNLQKDADAEAPWASYTTGCWNSACGCWCC